MPHNISKKEKNIRRNLFLASVFFDIKKADIVKKIQNRQLELAQLDQKQPTPPSTPRSRIQNLDPHQNTFVKENNEISNRYVKLIRDLSNAYADLVTFKKTKFWQCACCFWCYDDEAIKNHKNVLSQCEEELHQHVQQYPQLAVLFRNHQNDDNMQSFLDDAAEVVKKTDGLSPAQSIETELHKMEQSNRQKECRAKAIELMNENFHPFGVMPSTIYST